MSNSNTTPQPTTDETEVSANAANDQESTEDSSNEVETIEPALKPPFYYRFPDDIPDPAVKNDIETPVGSGAGFRGGVHTVRITAFAAGSGGQVADFTGITDQVAAAFGTLRPTAEGAPDFVSIGGGQDAAVASQGSGNNNESTSAENAGGAELGDATAAGGQGNGGDAGEGAAGATTQALGTVEFLMTNSPENRMSAQWDGTDFGLLGAALEAYRKGSSIEDALKSIADNPADTAEYALRKVVAMGTAVKQLALGGTAPDTLAAASKKVENPFREQLFKTMNFRTFPMQFRFAPKSQAETSQLRSAILELERNMHPEKTGLFLVYPSEFKVEFMYNGSPNEFLPTINSCILTDMNVLYGHGGFMTSFANSGGAPTEITLTLAFKEIFTRDRSHIQ